MLTQLSIRNVVLIEKLDLSFSHGLTVFTGETGAGKSILLDSLGLALGERASSSLIRNDANQASVTACFNIAPNHPSHQILHEQGLEPDSQDDLLVLRRVIFTDGRSRAYINDQPVGITLLRQIAQSLVEIQGQHEQMSLMNPHTHLDMLDDYGVDPAYLKETKRTFQQWEESKAKLEALRNSLEATAREEEWLRQSKEELSKLAPKDNEEIELADTRRQLQQSERRLEALTTALNQLSPPDRRAFQPAQALHNASRSLQRLLPSSVKEAASGETDIQAQEALEAIIRAEEALSEAESLLSRLAADARIDPYLLEQTEERLFALRAAGRKYGVPIDELSNLLHQFETRLTQLDSSIEEIQELEKKVATQRSIFEKAAEQLSFVRKNAAKKLEQAVMTELKPLKLERAQFFVSLTDLPPESWNQKGKEHIQFLIAANPGQPPAPLGKVASGGELSRLMLALKVVLSGQSTLSTLVFDEIDSGVGGATASAIGDRLHRVAQNVQVMVVTHSPQVAARADRHFCIHKTIQNGVTLTHAVPLDHHERQEEIARMLAGSHITDAARAAAESLINR